MQYMALPVEQREALLATLEHMPQYLEHELRALTPELMCQHGPDGLLSPLEQVWHLADLEREGFGFRIDKLLSEREPQLPDFDGAAIAAARHYRTRSFDAGVAAFSEARRRNIATLRTIAAQDWARSGQQQGVGKVSLCDIPSFMSQHDAAHRAEITAWKALMAA
jgi:DinB superfamily